MQHAIELTRQAVISSAEVKLGRLLTIAELAGIQQIGSLMLLESTSRSFNSPAYTSEKVLIDLEHFSEQKT